MGAPELLALSLGLSVLVAALGLAGGTLIERLSADPGLRDRVWGAALLAPVLPPVATALLLITPAPVREVMSAPAAPTVTIAAPTAMTTAPTPPTGLALNGTLIATLVVAVAVLLALLRIAALVVRARRLSRLIRTGEAPDAETMETVRDAARGLAISPPPVVISAATPEALLAGLHPARLVLPLTVIARDTGVTRAVIAHELAHLKRGDHRALWVEELVLALLAANPLMALLRIRRAAAREEACDAIALADAPVETRRAYAQTLIEALRNRAGPQSPGLLPALTFTGAGRTTAMHRLKAVLTPAAPAGRRARLITTAVGIVLLAATGVTTAALAGQREVEVRISGPQSGDQVRPKSVPEEFRINGQRIDLNPSTLPPFGFVGEAIRYADGRSTDALTWMDVTVSLDPAAPPLSLEGAPLPRGVKTDIIMPEFVERIERTATGLNIVLKRGADQPATQPSPAPSPALTVRIRQSAEPFLLGSEYVLRVALQSRDGERAVTRLEMPINPSQPLEREVRFAMKDDQLPTLTRGRTYDLTAEIRNAEGQVFYAAEPVTVRMAPGSRDRLARMTPELMLARVAPVSPPSVATRTYQARLTISEGGQVVAAGRLRLLADGGAVAVLNAGGRDYQFDLHLAGPGGDPERKGRLTARAEVARTASAGGWEPVAKPVLLMAPDGQARMTWGDEAGLMFDIVVEPA